jgi:hypothetical protein
LTRCGIITEEEVKRLCFKAREILIEEANVQVVDSPVTVRTVLRGTSLDSRNEIYDGFHERRYVEISMDSSLI